MERHVKERLIGAAVLIAAAVILIPEMLSGPDRAASSQDVPTAGDAPLKTYTIDLSRSSDAATASQSISEQAPPPEMPANQPQLSSQPVGDEANPESGEPGDVADAAPAPAVRETPPAPSGSAPAAMANTPREPSVRDEPATLAPAAAPPAVVREPSADAAGWAVQVGSFGTQATADKLVRELRADGHTAFVMPVKSNGKTLYRVRVGPMSDRDAATRALAKVKAKVPTAVVVKHP